jgi:hypothetical protein
MAFEDFITQGGELYQFSISVRRFLASADSGRSLSPSAESKTVCDVLTVSCIKNQFAMLLRQPAKDYQGIEPESNRLFPR